MVHTYQLNGYNIALDAGSGSVHAVDRLVFDILTLYETKSRDEVVSAILQKYTADADISRDDILEALDDIDALKAAGEAVLAGPLPGPPAEGRRRDQGALPARLPRLQPLLRLLLCRGGAVSRRVGAHADGRGERAIDFLIEKSGKRRNLEVDFFGGEPLLNWDVVKETVAYARSIEKQHNKNFRFTLTTNGVLIDDDVIDFTSREMSNVVLSLDGRPEVHDRLRKTPGGGGSYGLIVPKFKELVARRGDRSYYIRGTYTHFNTDFTSDLLHMADLGFTELSMEPVVSKKGDPYALTEEDFPILEAQYERLAVEMLRRKREGRGFRFYHYLIDLEGGPCVYKRVAGCGVGTEYLAVTPAGDLYPCHQFVGDESYKMGNLWDGVTNTEKCDAFSRCSAASRPECRDCWARLFCAGGCAANAYHATGDIGGVYDYGCRLFKKRMECAIMMKVAEALEKTPPDCPAEA